MKNKSFFTTVALVGLIAVFATSGCGKSSSAQRAVGDTLTMCIPDTFTYWGMTDACQQSGWWKGTYDANIDSFTVGEFVFEHYSGFDIYSYWGGFTVANNGDWHCYSDPTYCKPSCDCRPSHWCDSIGSGGWIHNQWGVMARMGLNCDNPPQPQEDAPYLVAFGSGIDVHLVGNATFKPQEVWICNHPWPYYGNIYGDGFAKPLTDSIGAHFFLKIVDAEGGYVTDTLAWCYTVGSVEQSIQWHRVDLSNLSETQNLYFELETTDVGPYGPNTAFYFCMDKLKVEKSDGKSAAAKGKTVQKPKKTAEEFGDFLTVSTNAAGEAILYDAQGQVALKTNLKAGSNKFDAKHLPTGKYTMVHHHRVKHFIKK